MDADKVLFILNTVLLLCYFNIVINMQDDVTIGLLDINSIFNLFIINIHYFLFSHLNIEDITLCTKVLSFFIKKTKRKRWFIIYGVVLIVFIPAAIYITGILQSKLDQHVVFEKVQVCPYNLIQTSRTGDDLPTTNSTYERYQGEDIQFDCMSSTAYQCMWLFNDEPLGINWRHSYHTEKTNHTQWNSIYMLRISFLQQEDFGIYSCKIADVNRTKYDVLSNATRSDIIGRIICIFNLDEKHPTTEHLRIPIGGIFENNVHYFGYIADDYVVIDRTVNGEPLELVCGGDGQQCSLLLTWYRESYLGLETQYGISFHEHDTPIAYVACGLSVSCMCREAFGNYSSSFFRYIYNFSSNRYELLEINYPITYIIQPGPSPYLIWGENYSSKPDIQSYNYIQSVQTDSTVGDIVSFRTLFECFLVGLSVCISLLYVFFAVIYVSKLVGHVLSFCRLFKRLKKRRYVMRKRHFTIFIACCEEDIRWSVSELDPIFIGEGHTTFIHYRDTHPGQHELTGLGDGINTCGAFVVVVSNDSIECPLWIYQTDLILDQLVRRHTPKYNILVVRLHGALYKPVEEMINLRNLHCMDWRCDKSSEDCLTFEVICWIMLCDPQRYLMVE